MRPFLAKNGISIKVFSFQRLSFDNFSRTDASTLLRKV
jgi:hypothetical protein